MTSHISPARLPGLLKFLVLALLALTLCGAPFASIAQDATASSAQPAPSAPGPGPNSVVATVGDQQITEADLAFAAEDLGQDLQQVPQDQIRAVLLAQMIDRSSRIEIDASAIVLGGDVALITRRWTLTRRRGGG